MCSITVKRLNFEIIHCVFGWIFWQHCKLGRNFQPKTWMVENIVRHFSKNSFFTKIWSKRLFRQEIPILWPLFGVRKIRYFQQWHISIYILYAQHSPSRVWTIRFQATSWTTISFLSGDAEIQIHDLLHGVNSNTKLNDMLHLQVKS